MDRDIERTPLVRPWPSVQELVRDQVEQSERLIELRLEHVEDACVRHSRDVLAVVRQELAVVRSADFSANHLRLRHRSFLRGNWRYPAAFIKSAWWNSSCPRITKA